MLLMSVLAYKSMQFCGLANPEHPCRNLHPRNAEQTFLASSHILKLPGQNAKHSGLESIFYQARGCIQGASEVRGVELWAFSPKAHCDPKRSDERTDRSKLADGFVT